MKLEIYQINHERDENHVCFCSIEELPEYQGSDEVDASIYDKIYEGEVECATLEDVYRMFNVHRPFSFKGRSLSVSDVIHVVDNKSVEPGFYYVDAEGYDDISFDVQKTKERLPETMDVIYVEPGKPAQKTKICTELSDLQRVVDGYIEACEVGENIFVICNEDGKINGMTPNRALFDEKEDLCDVVFGPFFVCEGKGERFGSLSEEHLEQYYKRFYKPEQFLVRDNTIVVLPCTPSRSEEEIAR